MKRGQFVSTTTSTDQLTRSITSKRENDLSLGRDAQVPAIRSKGTAGFRIQVEFVLSKGGRGQKDGDNSMARMWH